MQTLIEQRLDHSIGQQALAANVGDLRTAPVERELKVRLQDSVGRYALLLPCRLIPGHGWINSWLETPLAADPVDWQNWDQPSIDF